MPPSRHDDPRGPRAHTAPSSPTTPTVLAFARSTSGFYFGELLAGLNRKIGEAGGRVVVVQTLDPGDVADVVVTLPTFDLPLGWDQVDGAVTLSLAAGAPYLQTLRQAGKPVVLASSAIDGFDAPVALPSNRVGTMAAVDHLVQHGHTRIGFVGSLVQADMRERYHAYREALVQHGLEDGEHLFVETPDSAEPGGLHAAAQVVAWGPDRPTAFMVATDRSALGLLAGLQQGGLRVPEDVAVIGFDNIEAGSFSTPSLSSVSQRFDEVGGLAGSLVLAAIRGEEVGSEPHTPTSVIVAARGSCGCGSNRLDDLGGSIHTVGVALPTLRAELVGLLEGALSGDTDNDAGQDDDAGSPAFQAFVPRGSAARRTVQADASAAIAEVDRLLAGVGSTTTDEMQSLLEVLQRLAKHPYLLHPVANAINDYVRRIAAASERPRGHTRASSNAARISGALWQVQAGAYLQRSQAQERSLTEQFQVASGLLDASAGDPRDLQWLTGTHVRAAVLGLWDGPPRNGRLRIAGTYDPHGALPRHTGEVVRVEAFPPREMVLAARPEAREATFVVPVRTREDHWGLLAVIGDIDTTSSRDTYHYWAALLCSAFEAETLQRTVRLSRERYAVAARAANDGLWEWDLATDELYMSERCRDLLGLDLSVQVGFDEWYGALQAQDRPAMRDALMQAMSWRDQPVEVEYQVVHPDGSTRWLLLRGLGVATGTAPVERIVGSLSDIHPRKELEEQLRQGALFDAVTGLPNRRLFLDRLGWAVEQAQRRDGARFAVVFLDLDGFKLINDSLGHLMGDELLQTVGERLRTDLRSVDTAARFGGDEFAVLLFDLAPEAVLAVVDRIQEAIAAPILLGEHEVAVTASVGITTSATRYTSAEDVLRDADIAMYHAKGSERGSASVFDPDMHVRATGRLKARGELRTALAEHQFVVHYQPIVALGGAGLGHFEALVRWEHPERGLLPPAEFLSVMEENGTIVTMGQWLVDEVCRQIAAWRTEYDGEVTVSVNISHREFWADSLLTTVAQALDTHGVPPECLVLEITESVIMADPSAARQTMTDLHGLGVRLHIDDFGTGQSSLHALRTFPVDALKIDGSFIRELGQVEQTTELVRIIVDMGKALGLDVVAECVETTEQAEHLQGLGCANAQGWLYARAMPGADAGALLGHSFAGADAVPTPRTH